MLALLIAPTVWAALSVWNAPGDPLPAAGPRETPGFMAPVNGSGPSRDAESAADPKLVAYLRANRGDARYLVATRSSADASPLILATGEPVMALGGFGGADQILGLDELKGLVARGEVRFFLLQGEEAPQSRSGQGFAGLSGPGDELGRWVREHCTTVPTEQWRSGNTDTLGPGGIGGGSTLYDCGSAAA
jgi:4-amino-4-deoxy-L-arabinose transferase-like glycosyltransferase